MFLLDTNVISETRRNKPHGAVLAWLRQAPSEGLYLSAISFGEIQRGIELTRALDPVKADAIEAWHRSFVAGEAPRRATMAGVVIHVRQGKVWLYAEAGRSGFAKIEVGDGEHVWDGPPAATLDN